MAEIRNTRKWISVIIILVTFLLAISIVKTAFYVNIIADDRLDSLENLYKKASQELGIICEKPEYISVVALHNSSGDNSDFLKIINGCKFNIGELKEYYSFDVSNNRAYINISYKFADHYHYRYYNMYKSEKEIDKNHECANPTIGCWWYLDSSLLIYRVSAIFKVDDAGILQAIQIGPEGAS